jgi:hypothetical protein
VGAALQQGRRERAEEVFVATVTFRQGGAFQVSNAMLHMPPGNQQAAGGATGPEGRDYQSATGLGGHEGWSFMPVAFLVL